MEDINKTSNQRPEDKKLYQADYQQGSKLFEKALKDYRNEQDPVKKRALKKVMQESFYVVAQSLKALKKERKKEKQAVEKDLQTYFSEQKEQDYQKLQRDWERFTQRENGKH